MNTIALASSRTGSAARATRKCDRTFNAKMSSHSSGDVPASTSTHAETDVRDDAVETAESAVRFVDQTLTGPRLANVRGDRRGLGAFLLAEGRRELCRVPVDVDTRDTGSLPCAQHCDATPVADRCLGILGWPRASADNDDATTGEAATACRGAKRLRSEGHWCNIARVLYGCTARGPTMYSPQL